MTPTNAALASSSPASAPRPTRGPWHERVGDLHVLKLTGSHYEMGRQHGEFLAADVRRGPIPYYRTYFERMLGRSGLGPLSPIAWPLIQRLIGDRVARNFPDYAADAIRGLADGAGLDHRELLEGCSFPDAILWVASRLMQVKGIDPAMHHRLALSLGCTSAIAWGDATRDGQLLHARNLDYHGVECWPHTAAVIFHEPTGGLRYVSVSAAGVLMGGVTAMNEAGLTLTVHQHMFTDRAQLGGTPIGCVGDLIMRRARSLADAQEILRAHQPIGCWTYLVCDGKTSEVLCWEENAERQAVCPLPAGADTFGYTNIYLDRELGDTEKDLYGSYWRHNLARYRRAEALLAARHGAHDPASLAAILGDQGDGPCRISEAIGMVMTVGSVVFRPADGVLWVAAGPAPTSHQGFVPFSLSGERHAPELGDLPGGGSATHVERTAMEAYRAAYVAYVDHADIDQSRAHIERARQLQPEQPLFHTLGGLLALKCGDAGDAFTAFSQALGLGHPHPERLAAFHLWRARAADLDGRRDESLRDYRAALGYPADTPVREAARRGLRRPYRARRARQVDIDFTFADVVSP